VFYLTTPIEDDAILENVFSLTTEGESAFGNGTKLSVLNEGGGRELMMFDKLSSQIAYMLVTCRHDNTFIDKLESIIEQYSLSKRASVGKIGKGTIIKNCGAIKNVWIEHSAKIEGVTSLIEGTILSSSIDPVHISNGVIAKSFIIQSGSSVSDGALLDHWLYRSRS